MKKSMFNLIYKINLRVSGTLLLLVFIFSVESFATKKIGPMTNEEITKLSLKNKPFYGFVPYVPQKRDYGFELGAMWEDKNLYWIGAYAGFHLGTCVLSNSQSCQQYFDAIGGVGGREGLTEGLALGAIRWQFVTFPKFISPSARLFAGVMNVKGPNRDKELLVYGMGYGLSAAVHPAIDLKLNFRLGGGEKTWSQTFFTVSLKIDHVVNYFAQRLKAFGAGAVSATGTVIKGAAGATGTVIKGTGTVLKSGATVIKDGVVKTGEVIASPITGDKNKKKDSDDNKE